MRQHEPDCVYPQAANRELGGLCTCPRVASLPVPKVQHDPLCDEMDKDYEGYCLCPVITAARREEADRIMRLRYQQVTGWQEMKEARAWERGQRDMLAKCIAAVEAITYGIGMAYGEWLPREKPLAALQALREMT